MNKKRPVNLDLFSIRFPITAIVSILHRISGVILFLSIPILLCLLDQSLSSEAGFEAVSLTLTRPIAKLCVWGIVTALMYHLIAGVRHLLMDMHIGETLRGGRIGSYLVLASTALFGVLFGVFCIW